MSAALPNSSLRVTFFFFFFLSSFFFFFLFLHVFLCAFSLILSYLFILMAYLIPSSAFPFLFGFLFICVFLLLIRWSAGPLAPSWCVFFVFVSWFLLCVFSLSLSAGSFLVCFLCLCQLVPSWCVFFVSLSAGSFLVCFLCLC